MTFMRTLVKTFVSMCGFSIQRRRRVIAPYVQGISGPAADFSLWIANDSGQLWYGEPNRTTDQELLALRALVRPGMRVLEVGCHHGMHMCYLAQVVGSAGAVVAIEAEPGNALIAQAQIALNRFPHVQVINAAASDAIGQVTISLVDNQVGGTGMADEQVTVPAIRIDDLWDQSRPFGLLKIDVEGFEAKVLRGGARILAQRPALAIELHFPLLIKAGDDLEAMFGFLAGYAGTVMDPHGRMTTFDVDQLAVLGQQFEKVNLFLSPR